MTASATNNFFSVSGVRFHSYSSDSGEWSSEELVVTVEEVRDDADGNWRVVAKEVDGSGLPATDHLTHPDTVLKSTSGGKGRMLWVQDFATGKCKEMCIHLLFKTEDEASEFSNMYARCQSFMEDLHADTESKWRSKKKKSNDDPVIVATPAKESVSSSKKKEEAKPEPVAAPKDSSSEPAVTSSSGFKGWGISKAASSGGWKCAVCLVTNDTAATECVSCTTPKPGSAKTEKIPKPSAAKPAFSFASISSSSSGSGSSQAGSAKPAFSFAPPSSGSGSQADQKSSAANGFVFTPSKSASSSAEGGFVFSKPVTTENAKTPSSGFSFANKSSDSKPASNTGFSFASGATSSEEKPSESTSKAGFSFGGEASSAAAPSVAAPGKVAGTDRATAKCDDEDVHYRKLVEFYEKQNKEMGEAKLRKMLKKYEGREDTLLQKLEAKYNKEKAAAALASSYPPAETMAHVDQIDPSKPKVPAKAKQTPSTPTPSTPTPNEANPHLDKLRAFYEKHNKEKAADTPKLLTLLSKYKGREETLMQKLEAKYKSTPAPAAPSFGSLSLGSKTNGALQFGGSPSPFGSTPSAPLFGSSSKLGTAPAFGQSTFVAPSGTGGGFGTGKGAENAPAAASFEEKLKEKHTFGVKFGSTSSIGTGPSRETHPAARKMTGEQKASFANVGKSGGGFASFASPNENASKTSSFSFGNLASSTPGSGWAANASTGGEKKSVFGGQAAAAPVFGSAFGGSPRK